MKFPVGVSDFEKIATDGYIFVDKTMFIKEIMDDGSEAILITRPRRFGKTLNMSMLKYFFEIGSNPNIFKGLEIAKDKDFCAKDQNKYPVIFVSFKDVKKFDYDGSYQDIVILIRDLYGMHRYLLEDDTLRPDEVKIFNQILNKEANSSEIERAIKYLSEYLFRKFKQKPIILIDEYDTPIQEAYLRTIGDTKESKELKDSDSYYSKMTSLMRGIFGSVLKDNKYLGKAVITGITKIAQESMFSSVNNLETYSLLREEYGNYFGMLEDEVLILLQKTGLENKFDQIKSWYNGYRIGKYRLYNPWSMISCLKQKGHLKLYWVNTGGTDLIETMFIHASVEAKSQIERLIQQEEICKPIYDHIIFQSLKESDDAIWSILYYAGYLNIISLEEDGDNIIANISIPNKEVWYVYRGIVRKWFSRTKDYSFYLKFLENLVNNNVEKFHDNLSTYLLQTGSYFDFNKYSSEQVFHVFILGLVAGLESEYYISSNPEAGRGRADIAIIPKDKTKAGLILEFKTSKTEEQIEEGANLALKQIKERQYLELMKQQGVTKVYALGLCFFGQRVEIKNEVMEL